MRVHYNAFDEKEKSTMILGGMLKMKKQIFLSLRSECGEDPLLKIQEMEERNQSNQELENEESGNCINLNMRYWEYKEKTPAST